MQPSPLQGLHEALENVVKESLSESEIPGRKASNFAAEELLLKLTSHQATLHSESQQSSESRVTDQMYKIRNLDTGEEIDLRDENKADFFSRLTHLLATSRYSEALEAF